MSDKAECPGCDSYLSREHRQAADRTVRFTVVAESARERS